MSLLWLLLLILLVVGAGSDVDEEDDCISFDSGKAGIVDKVGISGICISTFTSALYSIFLTNIATAIIKLITQQKMILAINAIVVTA